MTEIPHYNVPAVLKLKHVKSLCILPLFRKLNAKSCWSYTAFLKKRKKEKTILTVISIGSVWVPRPILLQPVWSSYTTHSKEFQNPEHPCLGTGMLFWVAEFCLPSRIHFCGTETDKLVKESACRISANLRVLADTLFFWLHQYKWIKMLSIAC